MFSSLRSCICFWRKVYQAGERLEVSVGGQPGGIRAGGYLVESGGPAGREFQGSQPGGSISPTIAPH